MVNQPILSICIPTFKREYLVDELLQSIYAENCDNELFDICITDNSETDETRDLIESKYTQYHNLHYKKVTCKGFMNSVEALKFGDGQFLKLHNDYSIFKPGSLTRLIAQVQKYQDDKPLIFYTLRGKKDIEIFDSYDAFMYDINYLCTWSTSFAIWKEDLDRIMSDPDLQCNYMYPHTTILFREDYKKSFVVDDYAYFINKQPKKKGGYNLLDNFVRIFLTMLREDLVEPHKISSRTYQKIEKNILRFCATNYVALENKEGITYTFDDKKDIITAQCGKKGYVQFMVYAQAYRLLRGVLGKK